MLEAASVGIGWRHAHYRAVLEERPRVDFLEVHAENFFGAGGAALAVLDQARAYYPVSLHGVGLGLGSAVGIDEDHLAQLAALVDRVQPALVSEHACFARAPLRGALAHAADLLPLPFTREALDVLAANVQRVQDRLRRPIALENLSAYLRFQGAEMDEPAFLASLVRRTGCRLLLDVNNVYVNALNARYDGHPGSALAIAMAFLDALPAGCVAEYHVAGHRVLDDIAIDDHGSRVAPHVWQLYGYALGRFGAAPTVVEWDTDVPPLPVLLEEARLAGEWQAAMRVVA